MTAPGPLHDSFDVERVRPLELILFTILPCRVVLSGAKAQQPPGLLCFFWTSAVYRYEGSAPNLHVGWRAWRRSFAPTTTFGESALAREREVLI